MRANARECFPMLPLLPAWAAGIFCLLFTGKWHEGGCVSNMKTGMGEDFPEGLITPLSLGPINPLKV
jgi:hypothetical protein